MLNKIIDALTPQEPLRGKWIMVTETYPNGFKRRIIRLRDRSKYIPAGINCNVDHKPKHLRQA